MNKTAVSKILCIIAIIIAIGLFATSAIITNPVLAGASIVIFGLCVWYLHFSNLDYQKNLYQKVSWIALKDDPKKPAGRAANLRNFDLDLYVIKEQNNRVDLSDFRIDPLNEEEDKAFNKILALHKQDVLKLYFSDSLEKSEDIYKLGPLDYYFYSLHSFIVKNCTSSMFSKNFSYRASVSNYETKYNLTDFGRAYYKIRLIAWSYIEKKPHIRKLCGYVNSNEKEYICEALTKNVVSIYNFY